MDFIFFYLLFFQVAEISTKSSLPENEKSQSSTRVCHENHESLSTTMPNFVEQYSVSTTQWSKYSHFYLIGDEMISPLKTLFQNNHRVTVLYKDGLTFEKLPHFLKKHMKNHEDEAVYLVCFLGLLDLIEVRYLSDNFFYNICNYLFLMHCIILFIFMLSSTRKF